MAANVQVWHSTSDGAVGNGPHHRVQLRNTGSVALDLSKVQLRYWLNCDCGSEGLQAWVDWAGLLPSGSALSASIAPQAFSGAAQTHVLVISFSAGNLPAGGTAEVQFRFNRGNWATMDQSNDYSFAAQAALGSQARIAAYVNGALAWGMAPAGVSAAMASAAALKGLPSILALRVGPNPAHGRVALAVDLPWSGRLRLQGRDLTGAPVLDRDLGLQRAGTLQLPLELGRLAPGVYLLLLEVRAAGELKGTAQFKLAME